MALASIVAITHPNLVGCYTAEEFVAYAARVSNPANQNNTATAGKLIRYLIRNKHWSPFEMVSITMEINTTRDIGRQILRHRSFAFQEFSQRYAVAQNFTIREARLQDTKNRQNSIETDDDDIKGWWNAVQENISLRAQKIYDEALKLGIAKEQARAVLPEGLTETRMYMAGTLRSWIHYCDLRCGNGTQLEHREVAESAREALRKEFPNVIEALEKGA
jgi:thymidylate synthase (FAD)